MVQNSKNERIAFIKKEKNKNAHEKPDGKRSSTAPSTQSQKGTQEKPEKKRKQTKTHTQSPTEKGAAGPTFEKAKNKK